MHKFPTATEGPRLLVLMEGVEVPAERAVITAPIGTSATCTVTLHYASSVFRLKPRTTILVFEGGKHAFCGELVNQGFTETSEGRRAVLTLVDGTINWSQARSYFFTGFTDISWPSPRTVEANVGGYVQRSALADMSLVPNSYITKSLLGRSRLYPQAPGVLGGIVRLLEDLAGLDKVFANPFFTSAQMRLNLLQQIGVAPNDTTARKLLSQHSSRVHIRKLVKSMGRKVSYATTIAQVLKLIHYIRTPVVFPAYLESYDYAYTAQVPAPSSGNKSKSGGLSARIAALTELRAACNGDFNQLATAPLLDRIHHAEQQYRPFVTPAAVEAFLASAPPEPKGYKGSFSRAVNLEYDEVRPAAAEIAESIQPFRNGVISNQLIAKARDPYHTLFVRLRRAIDNVLSVYGRRGGRTVQRKRKGKMPPRMPTVLMVPNLFFAPPPACNVVFDDDVVRMQYNQAFMQEVTRLLLSIKPERNALGLREFPAHQFMVFPNVEDKVREKFAKKATGDPGILLPHERFTGIVPAHAWAEDLKLFKSTRRKQKKETPSTFVSEAVDTAAQAVGAVKAIAKGKMPGRDRTKYRKYNKEYLGGYGHFEFFSRRFAARSLSAELRYTPELVAGLPCAVIREDFIITGLLTSVTHNITSTAASTRISMTFCRLVPLEPADDPYGDTLGLDEVRLDVEEVDASGRASVLVDVTRNDGGTWAVASDADIRSPGNRRPLGPNLRRAKARALAAAENLPSDQDRATIVVDLSDVGKRKKKASHKIVDLRVNVEALITMTARSTGSASAIKILHVDSPVPVTDEIRGKIMAQLHRARERGAVSGRFFFSYPLGMFTTEVVGKRPFEEIVRPPWLDTVWGNSRIGSTYEGLIGCKSILEAANRVFSGNATTTTVQTATAALAAAERTVEGIATAFRALDDPASDATKVDTVDAALRKLHQNYFAARSQGFVPSKVAAGIRGRTIATFQDTLGSPNDAGHIRIGPKQVHVEPAGVEEGRVNLRDNPQQGFYVAAVGTTPIRGLPAEWDPRSARRVAAEAYAKEVYSKPVIVRDFATSEERT